MHITLCNKQSKFHQKWRYFLAGRGVCDSEWSVYSTIPHLDSYIPNDLNAKSYCCIIKHRHLTWMQTNMVYHELNYISVVCLFVHGIVPKNECRFWCSIYAFLSFEGSKYYQKKEKQIPSNKWYQLFRYFKNIHLKICKM